MRKAEENQERLKLNGTRNCSCTLMVLINWLKIEIRHRKTQMRY